MADPFSSREPLDYLVLVEVAEQHELEITPAELHGVITGSVCTANSQPEGASWIRLVVPYISIDQPILDDMTDALRALFSQTRQSLESTLFEFDPVLPDMESSADFRTRELAAWCRGFMVAYKHAQADRQALGVDACEVLSDLQEIALAETGEGEDEDLDAALAELEEYIRVGVQIIYDDLNPVQTVH